MKRVLFAFCLMGVLCMSTSLFAESDKDIEQMKEAAVEAAQQWLGLVDEAKFNESWEEAASYFKGVISSEDWQTAITGVRTPLGAVISRELLSAQYHTTLPGAPDGQYVIILFSTSFENKAEAMETITPMKDADGSWRVSGYFIK